MMLPRSPPRDDAKLEAKRGLAQKRNKGSHLTMASNPCCVYSRFTEMCACTFQECIYIYIYKHTLQFDCVRVYI